MWMAWIAWNAAVWVADPAERNCVIPRSIRASFVSKDLPKRGTAQPPRLVAEWRARALRTGSDPPLSSQSARCRRQDGQLGTCRMTCSAAKPGGAWTGRCGAAGTERNRAISEANEIKLAV